MTRYGAQEARMLLGLCIFLLACYPLHAQGMLSLHIAPNVATLVHPGQSVSVLCSVGVALHYCRITVPCLPPRLSLKSAEDNTASYQYNGRGLQYGQCGITIGSVVERCNGWVTCEAGVEETGEHLSAEVELMVARSPHPPELYLLTTSHRPSNEFNERDMLQATCHVRDARPEATITWYMGDDVITEGLSSLMYEENARTALHTVSQNLTRHVTWRDDNVDLSCVSGHVTDHKYNRTSVRIHVKYAPEISQEDNDLYPRFALGKPGTVFVSFMANPRPGVTWMFGDNVILREGSSDPMGRLYAVPVSDQGGGKWIAELRIERVRAEDIGLYLMLARNEIGVETHHVFIRDDRKYMGSDAGKMSRFPLTYTASLVIASCIVAAMMLILFFMCCEAFRQGRKPTTADTVLAQPIQLVIINGNSSNPGPSTSTSYQYTPVPTQEQEIAPVSPSQQRAVVPTDETQQTNFKGIPNGEQEMPLRTQQPASLEPCAVAPTGENENQETILHTSSPHNTRGVPTEEQEIRSVIV